MSHDSVKILPYHETKWKHNFLQFHTIIPTKILRLGINPSRGRS